MRPRKPDHLRVHRYKGGGGPPEAPPPPSKKVTELEAVWDGVVRGPELPERAQGWPKATLSWWETWRNSPQAKLCMPTDWEAMLIGAEIHARMNAGSSTSNTAYVNLSAELRKIVGSIGGSFEDRQTLDVQVNEVPDIEMTEEAIDIEAKVQVNYAERLLAAQAAATQERPS